ncbi:MAG: UDP-N-acetylmuramate dehydrogenase [Psychromonas sp.]|nr:UDP-N-acetylmuramate dehydrogenase [Psychromonas sp.]
MLSKNASLKKLNSFGLNVTTKTIFLLTHENQLPELITAVNVAKNNHQPVLILGGGTNILFCENFNGLIIKVELSGIDLVETHDHFFLNVSAGENWHQLVVYATQNNIRGLENLALIPGVVGAAPVQNIGAYGVEFEQICEKVKVIDLITGKLVTLSNKECEFSYRYSIFKTKQMANALITSVTLKLKKNWRPQNSYGALKALGESVTAQQIFTQVCEIRKEKLPDIHVLGNAGSFFKNPIVGETQLSHLLKTYPNVAYYPYKTGEFKLAAAWLIDHAKLKGFQIGGALVHQQHALVLINKGNASPADVLNLAWHVREVVQIKFGVLLEHEVCFINKNGVTTLVKEITRVRSE